MIAISTSFGDQLGTSIVGQTTTCERLAKLELEYVSLATFLEKGPPLAYTELTDHDPTTFCTDSIKSI